MPTYVIGDVQGCLPPLQQLLEKIAYNPAVDELWFTGDLINRGYHSLETLRFIHALPNTIVVLGNHDLALLAIANGSVLAHPKDTFDEILKAPDREALLTWLRHRPLLHHDPVLGFTLTHAGIYPAWDLKTAQQLAKEVAQWLQGPHYQAYLDNLYGNEPVFWHDDLQQWERTRFITNAFTRMRFCTPTGALELNAKGNPAMHPDLVPWFAFAPRKTQENKLIFGHWAALTAHDVITENVYPLDSGCVWGNCLTALCLQDEQKVSIDCKDYIDQPLHSKAIHGKVAQHNKATTTLGWKGINRPLRLFMRLETN